MKRLSLFLVLVLLILSSTTYLYYTHWRSEQQAATALPYIPQSAALVYEVADFAQQWANFRQTPMGEDLKRLPAFVAIAQSIHFLQSLLPPGKDLGGIPLAISLHGLEEDHLDYIFYLDLQNGATKAALEAVLANVAQDKACSETVRKYSGHEIVTLKKRGATASLSYINHKQQVIASFSSLLMEDVVLGLANQQQARLLEVERGSNTAGSLYINFARLPALLRTFVGHAQADSWASSLATFAPPTQLNLKLTGHHLLLSGLAKEQPTTIPLLTHTLAEQTPLAIRLAPCLPQSTAVLRHITFSDWEALITAWQKYSALPRPHTKEGGNSLLVPTLHALLAGEIAHCTLENGHGEHQLVIMRVSDAHAFVQTLQGAGLLTLLSLQERQHAVNAYQLKAEGCQAWLPGQLFPTFSANFLTYIEGYIVLANKQAALQAWHTQYQQGKTWENSPPSSAWLTSALDPAQLSLWVDLPKAWPTIMHALKPSWQEACKPHANALQKLVHASIQLLHEAEGDCYMTILLQHQEELLPQTRAAQQHTTRKAVDAMPSTSTTLFQTAAPITHRPWLVRSHCAKGHYVLVQDGLHQLYFIAPTGQLLWKKTLEGPITTELFEVDFYNNNKTQYLFATATQLHLIDCNGRAVSKYPQPLPQPNQPSLLNVVDYNHDLHYRFLIANAAGNIYLKNQYYQPLPDWNPLALGQGFVGLPFHLRIQGKDYLLALQTNGRLQLMNRKGKNYTGFPIDLKADVHNPLVVRKGKTAAETLLIVLTDAGQRVSFNLTGKAVETVQLDRPDERGRFVLCPNNAPGQQYVIMRQDSDKITVMDERGDLLFSLQHHAPNGRLTYYDFGEGHQFYLFTAHEQATYLHDHAGRQLNEEPFRYQHGVRLVCLTKERKLKVYGGIDQALLVQTVIY